MGQTNMRWGDYIEVTDGPMDTEFAHLLKIQMLESFPQLEGFNPNEPYRIGWFVEQGEEEVEDLDSF